MRTREILSAAKKLGRQYGHSAGTWCIDGNTMANDCQQIVQGIEDCDPMILDRFNEPSLSGEFADNPTPKSLLEDIGVSEDDSRLDWLESEVCDTWETAARAAFWTEVERAARVGAN